jgi:hypothetical protein
MEKSWRVKVQEARRRSEGESEEIDDFGFSNGRDDPGRDDPAAVVRDSRRMAARANRETEKPLGKRKRKI